MEVEEGVSSSSSSRAGTQGNLLEDSHGPAAADRTAPWLSVHQTEANKDAASATLSSLSLPQTSKKTGFIFLLVLNFSFSFPASIHPSSRSCPPPPPHCRSDSWPAKRRHGSGERRRRQRRDVEEASGRHQEDLRF